MRRLLLWAAGGRFLERRLSRSPAVRWVLSRYMPGEDAEAALEAADRLAGLGITATFTDLGENVRDRSQAELAVKRYVEVLDRASERGLDAEVSVKPTHLGLDLDLDTASRNLEALAAHAGRLGTWVWIDMESSGYVDPTLALYRRVRERFPNVGICLQAYLRRTERDVRDLAPLAPAIRLVKGAYREPPSRSFRSRAQIDRSYLGLAIQVLRSRRDRGSRLALGTHDVRLIEAVFGAADRLGLPTEAAEVQMLYGIREADQLRFAERGRPTRVLIAYGSHWYPWFMRRLAERPANALLLIRGLWEGSRAPRPPRRR